MWVADDEDGEQTIGKGMIVRFRVVSVTFRSKEEVVSLSAVCACAAKWLSRRLPCKELTRPHFLALHLQSCVGSIDGDYLGVLQEDEEEGGY